MIADRRHPIPTYGNFARSQCASDFPEYWEGMRGAWIPYFGMTGDNATVQDLSGEMNNVDFEDGLTIADAWHVTGDSNLFGMGIELDGSANHLETNGAPWSTAFANGLTCEIWFKCDTGADSTTNNLVSQWNFPGLKSWVFTHHNNNQYFFELSDGSASANTSGGTVDANVHQVVAVWQPGTYMAIYVDGLEVSLNTTGIKSSIGNQTSNPFTIGSQIDNSNFLQGSVYGVTIWDRIWSEYKIKELHEVPFAAFRRRKRYHWAPPAAVAPTDGVAQLIFITGEM